MNGKTVNKSISFLFCDCFWLSSKQWIDFLNNSSYIKPGQCTLRYAVWISHLLLPFRSFHSFSSVSISRVWIFCRWKRICSSSPAEGCAVWWYSVWLTSSRHSFSCLKKKKIKHSQQSISVCHNFPADVLFYTVPDCNSKSIPCVGKWPANANSGFNNQDTML